MQSSLAVGVLEAHRQLAVVVAVAQAVILLVGLMPQHQ